MPKTYAEQLDEVQAAISAVMSGQSYEIAGRKMVRANLTELSNRERYLQMMVSRQANGGIVIRGMTPLS